jgi:surface polysaccharide O-acyltransferase-like enzyme
MMSQTSRISHIDSLRGVAVLLMVMVHAAATWNPFKGDQETILAYLVSGLGGLAAPLFVTLFGWGMYRSKPNVKARMFQATFLIFCQILVNISSPHLFNHLTPGILSLMALLTIIFPLIQYILIKLNKNIIILILMVTLLFQILLPEIQGIGDWGDRVEDNSLRTILSNLFLTGTYPLFPWFLLFTIGATISSLETKSSQSLPVNQKSILVVVIGSLFCIVTFIMAQYNDKLWAHPTSDAYLTFFPANPAFIVAAITGTLLIWFLVQHFVLSLLVSTGRISLTIYVIHFIPLSLMHNFENDYQWSVGLSASIVMLYTLIWIPISLLWLKYLPSINLEKLLRLARKSL